MRKYFLIGLLIVVGCGDAKERAKKQTDGLPFRMKAFCFKSELYLYYMGGGIIKAGHSCQGGK